MSLSQRVERARAAEAEVVLRHQSARRHLAKVQTLSRALVTPGRLIGTGLATGFLLDRVLPKLRHQHVTEDIRHGTDVLQRIVRLASTALPLALHLQRMHEARDGHPPAHGHD